jgi:hypothetical protein
MRKVTVAGDTIYCRDRVANLPKRPLVLVEIKEVKDTTTYGGGITDANCRREKKVFTNVLAPRVGKISLIWFARL